MNSFSRDSAPKEEEVFPSKRISSPSVRYTNSNLFFMELIHHMNGGGTLSI